MYAIVLIYIYGNMYCFMRIGGDKDNDTVWLQKKKVLKENHISKS